MGSDTAARTTGAIVLVTAAVTAAAALAGESATARTATVTQDYPQRPIRIIDGFPAGGATDYLSRVIGQKLSERFGQTVLVENRPGAAGNIGAEIAAHATPDGYSLHIGLTSILAPSRSLYSKLNYDLLNDFAYVTLVASGTYILSVHPSVPARSLSELVALAKSKPGQLSYSSGGVASSLHLAGEILKNRTGVDILHVPYKGGAPAAAAVTAGEVQLGFASPAAALPLMKGGRIIALAVSSAKRAKAFPELPTIAESGYPGFDVTPWYGILAPVATPAPIIRLLNVEIAKVLQMADVQALFATQGMEAAGSTPEQFKQIMQAEVAQWAKVIRDANIKGQ